MIEKLPYEELINKYRNASKLNKKYVKELKKANNIINELEEYMSDKDIYKIVLYKLRDLREGDFD